MHVAWLVHRVSENSTPLLVCVLGRWCIWGTLGASACVLLDLGLTTREPVSTAEPSLLQNRRFSPGVGVGNRELSGSAMLSLVRRPCPLDTSPHGLGGAGSCWGGEMPWEPCSPLSAASFTLLPAAPPGPCVPLPLASLLLRWEPTPSCPSPDGTPGTRGLRAGGGPGIWPVST